MLNSETIISGSNLYKCFVLKISCFHRTMQLYVGMWSLLYKLCVREMWCIVNTSRVSIVFFAC